MTGRHPWGTMYPHTSDPGAAQTARGLARPTEEVRHDPEARWLLLLFSALPNGQLPTFRYDLTEDEIRPRPYPDLELVDPVLSLHGIKFFGKPRTVPA